MHHPNYLDNRNRLNQYAIKDNWGELVKASFSSAHGILVLRLWFNVFLFLYLSSIFIKLTYMNSINSRILVTNH